MNFEEFAHLLEPYLRKGRTIGEYTRSLFEAITDASSKGRLQLHNISETSYRGYYNGATGISTPASKILGFLDLDSFKKEINNLSFDAQTALFNDFSQYDDGVELNNLSESIAKTFSDIIHTEAKRTRGKTGDKSRQESSADEVLLMAEANGICPQCGKPFLQPGKTRTRLGGRIVEIMPCEARFDYRKKKAYEELSPYRPTIGSLEDKIFLCTECADEYEDAPSADAYKALIEKKLLLRKEAVTDSVLMSLDLEEAIVQVIGSLGQINDFNELEQFGYEALRINSKIIASNQLLRSKIADTCTRYYRFVEDQFRHQQALGNLDFDDVCYQIKTCYKKLADTGLNQTDIFNRIGTWIAQKAETRSTDACEVIAAFFVQNCEVFDDLSKQDYSVLR